MDVALADKLAQLAGLHDVEAGGLAVVPAVEVNLGQGEGGDGHITHSAVLPLSQPELGVIVGVDVLVQFRVGDQLPLQQPQVGSVPVTAQVLIELAFRAAVSLTNLRNYISEGASKAKCVQYLAVETSVGRGIGLSCPGEHSLLAGEPDRVLSHLLHVPVRLEMLDSLLL